MKEKFQDINFKLESLTRIRHCNAIIDQYQKQGLKLTLRQLFYQLVVTNAITNSERSYQNLSSLVTNARMSGLMDWEAIEDRVRQPQVPSEFEDLDELVEAALHTYRLPRWKGQDNYVELWVEKDALAGVLRPIAKKFHITMMVNRGYSSASAMYESADRFHRGAHASLPCPKEMHLLYLGDHDPSGEDMVRDVRDRLRTLGAEQVAVLHVLKIALTMTQVTKYKPPPNPAKISDPRAEGYIKLHGNNSWEVDALPPNILTSIITKEIENLVDMDMMNEIIEEEKRDKKLLTKAVASLRKKSKKKKE